MGTSNKVGGAHRNLLHDLTLPQLAPVPNSPKFTGRRRGGVWKEGLCKGPPSRLPQSRCRKNRLLIGPQAADPCDATSPLKHPASRPRADAVSPPHPPARGPKEPLPRLRGCRLRAGFAPPPQFQARCRKTAATSVWALAESRLLASNAPRTVPRLPTLRRPHCVTSLKARRSTVLPRQT